jgi:hypothetical protein
MLAIPARRGTPTPSTRMSPTDGKRSIAGGSAGGSRGPQRGGPDVLAPVNLASCTARPEALHTMRTPATVSSTTGGHPAASACTASTAGGCGENRLARR